MVYSDHPEPRGGAAPDPGRADGQIYRDVVDRQVDLVCRFRPDMTITFVNPAFADFYGRPAAEWAGTSLLEVYAEYEREAAAARLATFGPDLTEAVEEDWELRADGVVRWYQWTDTAILDEHGQVLEIQSVGRDVTERRTAMVASLSHARILEQVASGDPLPDTLKAIAGAIEDLAPDLMCCVSLFDHDAGVLRPVAGPSLPAGFVTPETEVRIGPGNGPCGTAAYLREPVLLEHLGEDGWWAECAGPLVERGVASVLSTPLCGTQGSSLLGVLTVYGHERGGPDEQQRQLVDTFARIAEVAIERKEFEERLAHQSLHDLLTGLPNRLLLLDRLEHAIARAARTSGRLALVFLDLDRFKDINDGLGHDAGDELLVAVARRLADGIRTCDTVARYGGDEFVVLLEDLSMSGAAEEAVLVAEGLLEALAVPFVVGDGEVFVSATVGIALVDGHRWRPDELLRDADAAMYHAKASGSRIAMFDESLRERVVQRHATFNALHRALERHEFIVHYQPIVSLASGEVTGAEALIRWQHPERGLVPPAEFIPLAESSNLIVGIGDFVLEESARLVAQHAEEGGDPLLVTINLSARQLSDPALVERIGSMIERYEIDPTQLCLEITESVVMRDADASLVLLEELRSLGVRLAVDDFGTGYSSLAYLKRFPVDTVKIDRSFVDGLPDDPSDAAIVAAVVRLAHAMGLEVVAEGVETVEQLEALRALGCDRAQGFLFARPGPVERFADLRVASLLVPGVPAA